MLLKELIQLYISEILPSKRPQTQKMQKGQLLFWSKHLGDLQVKEVKPIDIIRARGLLAISDASKNIYIAALCHVFSIAIREFDLLDSNPVSKVKNLKNPRGRVRFLSDEERKNLLIACGESGNQHLYLVVVLALTTGARKNEILTLTWGDIDLAKQLIFLNQTKNGEIGTCTIAPEVMELLIEKKKEIIAERWLYTDFIFKSKFGNKSIDIRSPFAEAKKRAGITNFKFHDLRHSFASYLAMNGASMSELMELMRHKSPSMCKRYAHLSTAHKSKVINSMVEKMEL
jgi:integrase